MFEKSDKIVYLSRDELAILKDESGEPLNDPRRTQNTVALQNAIKAAGDRILQPLVVAKLPDGKVYLVAGHRRLVATSALGLYPKTIPCLVSEMTQAQAELAMVAANRQRALTLRESVKWAVRLKTQGFGDTKISEAMGKGATTVWRLRKLAEAHPDVQEAVYSSRLPFRSFELMATKSRKEQKEILSKARSRVHNSAGKVSHKTLKKAKADVKAEREPELGLGVNAVDQLKGIAAILNLTAFDVKPHDKLRFLFVLNEMIEQLNTLRKGIK